jgi:hypothetical protein
MAEDVGDQEHLDQAVADPVEIDVAGRRAERQVLAKQLPATTSSWAQLGAWQVP